MMFEPIRGGTRGGQAEFKWADVSADKDRENYLGHSINAPTGRWQKNKDVHWYNRDKQTDEEARLEEIRKIKEAEADALAVALGFAPEQRNKDGVGPSSPSSPSQPKAVVTEVEAERALEKEEKRKRKAERKEEKRLKKEKKEERRRLEESDDYERRKHRHRTRSRSPRRRSRSPPPPRRERGDYGPEEMEREREQARKRWDINQRRNEPSAGRQWGRS